MSRVKDFITLIAAIGLSLTCLQQQQHISNSSTATAKCKLLVSKVMDAWEILARKRDEEVETVQLGLNLR